MKEYMMTQKEFAEKVLGLNQSHYNRIENNQMQTTLEKAFELAAKLNMKVDDVFYLSE